MRGCESRDPIRRPYSPSTYQPHRYIQKMGTMSQYLAARLHLLRSSFEGGPGPVSVALGLGF